MGSGEHPSATLRTISEDLRRTADRAEARARWEGGIDGRVGRNESDLKDFRRRLGALEDRVVVMSEAKRGIPKEWPLADTQPLDVVPPKPDPLIEARKGEITARTRFWIALAGLVAIATTAIAAWATVG